MKKYRITRPVKYESESGDACLCAVAMNILGRHKNSPHITFTEWQVVFQTIEVNHRNEDCLDSFSLANHIDVLERQRKKVRSGKFADGTEQP